MTTYIAQPADETQDKAIRAIFETLKVPYESEPFVDDTAYLMSTDPNKARLLDAFANEGKNSRIVGLDEIWK